MSTNFNQSTTDVIIDGLQWTVSNTTTSGRAAKSVVSLSVGGIKSNAFNAAINAALSSSQAVCELCLHKYRLDVWCPRVELKDFWKTSVMSEVDLG